MTDNQIAETINFILTNNPNYILEAIPESIISNYSYCFYATIGYSIERMHNIEIILGKVIPCPNNHINDKLAIIVRNP